jgi:sugar phosphate isomerase/epimerase
MIIRRDICLGGLAGLPSASAGHGLDRPEALARLAGHGFAGVVAWDNWDAIRAAGLIPCGMGRILAPAEALPLARAHADAGLDFTTLHVGTGFESDAAMDRLAEAVLEAGALSGHALHIETHRATMTQDIRRTIDLVARFAQLTFTLDFSHWYTGHEMTYGGEFAERLAHCDPVFARVESLQLRIGTTGQIQRPLDPASAHYRDHCAALDRCLAVRLAAPDLPQVLSAAPELLPAMMGEGDGARPINYADEPERSDRFAEAIALASLAQERLALVGKVRGERP